MDRIERIKPAAGFPHSSHARIHGRGRAPSLRLEWLEGRVMLSGSPSIHVAVGSLQGTFVAAGILTIGGSLFQGNSAQAGGAIVSGGGTVKVADPASPSNSALSDGGAVGTTSSPVTNSAGNSTNTPGNATTTSSLIGTSGSGSFINGQNGNPGGGTNLGTIASIANPAPNSIFVEPDQAFSKPETITFDPLPGTRELPDSTVPDAVGVAAPAEATGKAGGEVDIDFDVEVLPMDQAFSAPFTEPMLMSVSAATGSSADIAEFVLVTTSGSVSPTDPAHGGNARSRVDKLVIMTSVLATYSVNLAFGGAISNFGTMSWAARRWPATRRSNRGGAPITRASLTVTS
jgi:hypothetical protein